MGYGNLNGNPTDKMVMYVDDPVNPRFEPLAEGVEIKPQRQVCMVHLEWFTLDVRWVGLALLKGLLGI